MDRVMGVIETARNGFGKFLVRFFVYILTLIYPNYIIISFSAPAVMSQNLNLMKNLGLFSWVSSHRPTFDGLLIFTVFLFPGIVFFIQERVFSHRANRSLNLLSDLLFSIGEIVGFKRKRFHDHLEELQMQETVTGDTFLQITEPDLQIRKICDYIGLSFRTVCNTKELKVSIIQCLDGNMKNYLYHSDDRPTLSVEELRGEQSTARLSLENRKMILIPNVARRKEKDEWFYAPPPKDGNIGGILCYPVCVGEYVSFIITITSKRSGVLKKRKREIYELMLDEYSNRLKLEIYLLQIKEKHLDAQKRRT